MDPLIRTNLEKPYARPDVTRRPRLMEALAAGLDKRLIMVVAPAGYGKTTLLAQWLHEAGLKATWLSLDPERHDFTAFLAYFVAAIQSIDPRLGKRVQSLTKGAQMPPVTKLVGMLINELSELPRNAVFVLEDYHLVHDREVHELISALVSRWPQHILLVISSRSDPPLPLPEWRGRGYLAEIRAEKMRFTDEEAEAFLTSEIGVALPDHVTGDLLSLTEGWITGLKLAAISIRDRSTRRGMGEQIELVPDLIPEARNNRHIADYLLEDVFSRQPRAIREFLMRTSILNRFSAPLCDALNKDDTTEQSKPENGTQSTLRWIERSNLFIVPLDDEGRWFRYHHLFRELLANRLRQKHDAHVISGLHVRAGEWLAGAGYFEDALLHYLKAGDLQRAADLVEQQKHALLNSDDWRTLERWLNLLPDDVVQSRPALLLSRAWVMQFRGRPAVVAVAVKAAHDLLSVIETNDTAICALRGEMESLLAQAAFFNRRFDEAIVRSEMALEHTPRSSIYVRGNAIILYGLSVQAAGKSIENLNRLNETLIEDVTGQSPSTIRVVLTFAWMDCISGEWTKARGKAEYALKLAESRDSVLLAGWAHFFLGLCDYQQNKLEQAVLHLDMVVQNRYSGVHWFCAVGSMAKRSMSHLAQGELEQADETAKWLDEFAIETRDPEPMAENRSFQAHLNVLKREIAPAMDWANTANVKRDLRPFILPEEPMLTRLRILIADGSPGSLVRAEEMLPQALDFARSTQNVWREVELLALQALLHHAQDRKEAALDALDHALVKARPGRFVRAFVDLGDEMRALLADLSRRRRHVEYAGELLAAFDPTEHKPKRETRRMDESLVEPLTVREMEVLALMGQYLTNDEIAGVLFISPITVKSHIRHIFEKLGVKRRRFAIVRAKALGLLPSN